MCNNNQKRSIGRALGAVLLATSAMMPIGAKADPSVQILGATIGEWTARWVTWAVKIPEPQNPMVDTTGAYCDKDQQGPMWFLAGVWGSGAVQRNCTIPRGKSVIFPVVNAFWIQTEYDLPNYTVTDYRQCVSGLPGSADLVCTGIAPVTNGGTMTVTLDGVPVVFDPATPIVRTQSPLVHVTLPEDNIFGVPELASPPPDCRKCGESLIDGVWVILPAMKPGLHTLKSVATAANGDVWQDITYTLQVR